MSDEDRGAYSPQREAPLQFDARRARDARPMPMALMASAAVLIVLIGAVVAAYAGVFRHREEGVKTVGQPVTEMKTAPKPGDAAPTDPGAKLEVFSDKPATATPTFAPDTEKPAPRATLQVRPSTLPPVHIAPPEAAPAPERPTGVTAPRPVETAAAPKPPTAATDLATAAPAREATIRTTRAAAGSVGAQIGAFSSRELADKGFADVGRIASTSGRGKRVEAVEHGGSTLYRTTVTGFADRDSAKAFCAQLTAKGHACIVKG